MFEIYSVKSIYASIEYERLDVLREIIGKMKAVITEEPVNLKNTSNTTGNFIKISVVLQTTNSWTNSTKS